MERRDFLSWLFFKIPLTTFVVSVFFRCQKESGLVDDRSVFRDLPRDTLFGDGPPSHSSVDQAEKPEDANQNPAQTKISVLENLKERLNDAEIEIIFGENGDPYVKSISDFGSDCFYFTVNGKPYIGEGINVGSVFVDSKKDVVRWYCNGRFLNF